MRACVLPGSRDCGDLLMFEEVRRRLHLGAPVIEGTETIRVDDVIGTVGRGADFDGCFRPRKPRLAKRIREIRVRNPNAFNEPIDVVRVDRAYFVADGHKRVSIAKETGVEFIDARVSRALVHLRDGSRGRCRQHRPHVPGAAIS